MTQQPSRALVSDLQIAIRRLARRSTVMNLGLLQGLPLNAVSEIIRPVQEQAALVRNLIAQAESVGIDMDALHVQINQPISDELAGIFADLVDVKVPDNLEGL